MLQGESGTGFVGEGKTQRKGEKTMFNMKGKKHLHTLKEGGEYEGNRTEKKCQATKRRFLTKVVSTLSEMLKGGKAGKKENFPGSSKVPRCLKTC